MRDRPHPAVVLAAAAMILTVVAITAAVLIIWPQPSSRSARLIPAAQSLGTSSAASLCSTEGKYCNRALLQLINAERTQHGYQPLILSSIASYGTATCIGARGHAQHMAAIGQIAHDQFPSDLCYRPYSYGGENVGYAGGNKWSAVQTVFTLMETGPAEIWTPGCTSNHHCNFLSTNFTHIGIGFAQGAGGYWFQSEEFTG